MRDTLPPEKLKVKVNYTVDPEVREGIVTKARELKPQGFRSASDLVNKLLRRALKLDK